MRALFLAVLWVGVLFGHNLLEKVEEHLYHRVFLVDFWGSTMKKGGYGLQFKYGKSIADHNVVVDYKLVHIQTTPKLSRNLLVKKLSGAYQYTKGLRRMIQFLYIRDSLVKEANNVELLGGGVGYKDMEMKFYYKNFPKFSSYQVDFRYFLPSTLMVLKYNRLSQRVGIARNAQRSYLSVGTIFHTRCQGLHYGVGAFIGKRAFTVMEGGFDLEHHPFEFRYSLFAKVGKRIGNGIVHIGLGYGEAKELPSGVKGVRIRNIMFDWSLRF